jgi:flavin-dependent dehydrogenase
MNETDILVIGAGPTGLGAASRVAEGGPWSDGVPPSLMGM